jgi:hypothetical protein
MQQAVAIGCGCCISSKPPGSSPGSIAIKFIGSAFCIKVAAYAAARALYPRCFASFLLQSETFHLTVPIGVPRAAAIS